MNLAYQQKIMKQKGIFTKLFKYLELKGFMYAEPFSKTIEGWDEWHKKALKEQPIRYHIREFVEDIEYDVIREYRRLRYLLKTFFFPENDLIRKAIPVRNSDITYIITEMNFAAILQFKEEADKASVDWNAQSSSSEFKKWLDLAVVWIKEGRANLDRELETAYPDFYLVNKPNLDIEQVNSLYKEVHRIEALIKQTDENILVQMIKYRDYFWT
jgi:hypothetical protein